MNTNTPLCKIAATTGGTALTGAAIVMNAQHVAASDGWTSPLVWAAIIVTACAAVTPPFAERAAKTGQPAKAALMWLFFALAVGFSLTASIARSSGYQEGKSATVEHANQKARLAREAYEQATAARDAECKTGRGPHCRALEDQVAALRNDLASATPVQSVDPGTERLAAVLGVGQDSVALYVPLLLPLGLELGGFIFLAFGLAPAARREIAPAVAKIIDDAIANAKPKTGSRECYLQLLRRDHPEYAAKVDRSALSVYSASIAAGLRKPPKPRQWVANSYLNMEKEEVWKPGS